MYVHGYSDDGIVHHACKLQPSQGSVIFYQLTTDERYLTVFEHSLLQVTDLTCCSGFLHTSFLLKPLLVCVLAKSKKKLFLV